MRSSLPASCELPSGPLTTLSQKSQPPAIRQRGSPSRPPGSASPLWTVAWVMPSKRRSPFAGSSAEATPLRAYTTDAILLEALILRDDFDAALRMAGTCITVAQRDDQFWIARSFEYLRGRILAAAGSLDDVVAVLDGVSPTLEPYQVDSVAEASALAAFGSAALHTGNRRQSETCTHRAHRHEQAAVGTATARSVAARAAGDGRGQCQLRPRGSHRRPRL